MKRYPNSELLPGTIPNRRRPVGPAGTERGTFHTLEVPVSRGWYDTARVKDYYTFQYSGLGMGGTGLFLQVLNPEQISHALYHRTSDPETNGAGRTNISLAFLGYARDIGQLNNQDFTNLADFMIWCETELGITAEYMFPPKGSVCYGEFSSCRMSWNLWNQFGGWCGHQNVPGQATGHWDPGAFDVAALHAAIESAKQPVPPIPDPPLPPVQPKRRHMYPLTSPWHLCETLTEPEMFGYIDAGIIGLIDNDVAKTKAYWAGVLERRNPADVDWSNLTTALVKAHFTGK